MNNAYLKDILRTIQKSRKRFWAILIITVLGVTMFSGLQAACEDLRYTADYFFDDQKLHDLQIQSTLGLTEDDVEALAALKIVDRIEGVYAETVKCHIGDQDYSFTLQTLTSCGIDRPYVIEGRLPQEVNECAVTEKFLEDTGLQVGDTIIIQEDLSDPPGDTSNDIQAEKEDDSPAGLDSVEEEETPNFLVTEYTITASVVDVTLVDNPSGPTSYRGSQIKDLTILILPEAVETDVYTAVVLTILGADELFCYGNDYSALIEMVKETIETEIKTQREQARYEQIMAEANALIDDSAEDAYAQLDEAKGELEAGEQELLEQLTTAYQELQDAAIQIADGKVQLDDGIKQLDDAEKQLDDAEQQLRDGEAQILAAEQQMDDAEQKLAEGRAQLEEGKKQLEEGKSQLTEQETAARAQIAEARELLNSLSSLTGSLSEESYQTKSAASELLESDFPSAEWNAAVSAVSSKVSAALSGSMASLDLSSMNSEDIDALTGMIKSGSFDADTFTGLLEGNLDEESAKKFLSQIYAGAQNMTQEEWEGVMNDISEISSALNSLNTAYTEAVIRKEAELQEQITELMLSDPDSPAAAEQIASLQEQQERLASAGLWMGGAAVEAGLSSALSSSVSSGISELEQQETNMEEQLADAWQQLTDSETALAEAEQQIIDGEAEAATGRATIAEKRKLMEDSWKKIRDSRQTIADSRTTIAQKKGELEDAETQLEEGWLQYFAGKEEGENTLADGWSQYYDGLAELEEALAEAREKLSEIDIATWYLQDRNSLNGFSNIGSDSQSIKSLATVFPILFFVVAILISLTTITRMVEEDRGLIGTYKALGYSNNQIRRKYTIYASAASLAGSLVGTIMAFLVLPFIVILIFHVMYLLPYYKYIFLPAYGFTGPLLFIGGILMATWITCRNEMNITPAILMRPKAPKGGNRVFLEYIKPLWTRMTFLNKVTARNLFRYKKRLFMTIAGTAGCMALLLFGFAIRDSVHDLLPHQYEETFHYDVMAIAQPSDNDLLLSYFDQDERIEKMVNLEVTSVSLKYKDTSIDVQLMVFPDARSLKDYISFIDTSGEEHFLEEGQIYITNNASIVLGFDKGDSVTMQLLDLQSADLPVTEIAMNYLSNYVYMTAQTFESYYQNYEPNAVLLDLTEDCGSQIAYTDELKTKEGIISCLSTESMQENFYSAFILINMVVYVIIIMSAALAFVVLFTLSNTNISERQRELATLKVLGFFDSEVHLYVDKEALILTSIGTLFGIPLGRAFASTLTVILNLPNIYLAVSLKPLSYIYAVGLSLFFALIVNFIMDKALDKIDPVEALKSVE